MWTRIEKALKDNHPKHDHILARDFCLAWSPSDKVEAKKVLFDIFKDIKLVFANTPSVGQYWPTQPSFKYLGRPLETSKGSKLEVFTKSGYEIRISREIENIRDLSTIGIPVPRIIKIFETPKSVIDEEAELFPKIKIGKILIEEFLYSISLGHAIIDHRFHIKDLTKQVIKTLEPLHKIGMHGELKHQHIRIILDKNIVAQMLKNSPVKGDGEIPIKSIHFVDLETFMRNTNAERNKKIDLVFLKDSLRDYANKLDSVPLELLKTVTVFTKLQYYKRIEEFLVMLKADYFLF